MNPATGEPRPWNRPTVVRPARTPQDDVEECLWCSVDRDEQHDLLTGNETRDLLLGYAVFGALVLALAGGFALARRWLR